MKKLAYALAAVGGIALALPSIANAETVVIKKHHMNPYGARAEFREHRDFGWHRGWHHDGGKTVIIKRHREY